MLIILDISKCIILKANFSQFMSLSFQILKFLYILDFLDFLDFLDLHKILREKYFN